MICKLAKRKQKGTFNVCDSVWLIEFCFISQQRYVFNKIGPVSLVLVNFVLHFHQRYIFSYPELVRRMEK